MSDTPQFHVTFTYDCEADQWVASGEPGLAITANTIDRLLQRMHKVYPVLLRTNWNRPDVKTP